MTEFIDASIGEPITSEDSDEETEILKIKHIMKQHAKYRGPVSAIDEKPTHANKLWNKFGPKSRLNSKPRNYYKNKVNKNERYNNTNNTLNTRFGSASNIIIKQFLRCQVCKELYNNAVIFPCCGISCCKKCIPTANKETGETVVHCFDCSEPIDLENIITNYALQMSVNSVLVKNMSYNNFPKLNNQLIPPGTIRSINNSQKIVPLGGRVAQNN